MTEKEMQVSKKKEVQQAGEPTKTERQFLPAVDIFETDDAVTVLAEMPGVEKGGVDINLEDDVLTLKGKREGDAGKDEVVLLKEYESGSYLRRFTVSESIDRDKIEATMQDGILTLKLPKVAPAKPRKIEVKAV
jgi:HSP20 family protein